jgi:hypothetical protein
MLSATQFEQLLPWYLNGTLTEPERGLVADYLEAHPEQSTRVQWNASLRARIKEQVEELPQDLGLDRILGAMRSGGSEVRRPAAARERRDLAADFVAWVTSISRSRAFSWGAAFATVVIVAGTIALVGIHTTAPQQDKVATNTVSPAPTPSSAVHEAPPIIEPLAQARITPKSPQSRRRSAPAEPGAWGLSPSLADLRKQGNPTEPAQPEPTAIPVVPPAATTPAPVSTVPELASAQSPSAGPAAQTTPAPSPPGEQPAVPEAGSATAPAAPQIASGLSTQSSQQATIPSRSRAALSGKDDTSCPSTNKQREDALRAANPDQPVRTPAQWLEYIKELAQIGCRDAAKQEWVEFHKKYPDAKAPPELEASK